MWRPPQTRPSAYALLFCPPQNLVYRMDSRMKHSPALLASALMCALATACAASEGAADKGTAVDSTLPECPVAAELAGGKSIAAFNALPRQLQENMDDHCSPATVSSMILSHEGVCRIGNVPMTAASLTTLKDSGKPVALMFMAPYRPDTHAALQALLEARYAKLPLSAYRRSVPVHQEQTTIVSQPGGTMVILGKPSEGMPGAWMSSIQQLAPGNVDLVNRDLNRCR